MDSGRIIRFYDKDYHLLGVDDDAESIYTSRWNTFGTFEIFLKQMHKGVKEGNRIVLDEDGRKNGVITYIYQDDDGVTIRGYSLLWLLSQRITVPKTGKAYLSYNGAIEDVLYGLVKDCAVNAENVKRNFPRLECEVSQHRGATYKYQTRYDNLLECLQEISRFSMAGIGVRVIPEEAREVFEVRFGVDKSIDQNLNPQVVFRQSYDNILSESYTLNSESYKSTAYVGGQGEGVERLVVELGGEETGEDRREMFVDARDLEDSTDLADRGYTKLAECKVEESFEVSADSNDYGKRWNLGDKVTVIGETSGVFISDYVTEVTETIDESGLTLIPVFGIAETGITGTGSASTFNAKFDYSNPYDASIALADGSNLDDLIDPGICSLWGTNYINAPQAAFYGYMHIVKYHGTYRAQIAVRVSASLTAAKKVYIRHKNNSGWSEWAEIL